jgi:large subunit ribosomal protein L30
MKEGQKIVLRQTRSAIAREGSVLKTLVALGLGRPGKTREHVVTKALLGQIRKVEHLVTIS